MKDLPFSCAGETILILIEFMYSLLTISTLIPTPGTVYILVAIILISFHPGNNRFKVFLTQYSFLSIKFKISKSINSSVFIIISCFSILTFVEISQTRITS